MKVALNLLFHFLALFGSPNIVTRRSDQSAQSWQAKKAFMFIVLRHPSGGSAPDEQGFGL
ncbi:Uncharacterised protein [Yersinia ruckeri]|nr:Uncharacterised protein [Yersinia ruckeri]